MKIKIVILLLFIGLNSCVSVQKHNEKISKLHTVSDLRSDVDNLYLDLKKYHPRLYQYKSKKVLDFKFDSLKKSIKEPMNSRAFYKKTAAIIAQMGHGHTAIYPPVKRRTRKEKRQLNNLQYEFNTLSFEYLNEKLFLSRVQQSDSLLLGAEVLKVNNEDIKEINKKYRKLFSSDGFNTTYYNKVIGTNFKSLYYNYNGSIGSVNLTLKTKDSIFERSFKKILIKDKNVIRSAKKQDSLNTKIVKKQIDQKIVTKKERRKYNKIHGFDPINNRYNRNLKFIGKDSAIAFMKIRRFEIGNYKEFYKQAFTELANKKTQNLIIDLRYNGGGRALEIRQLYSYLTDKEFQFFTKSEVNTRTPILKTLITNTTPLYSKIIMGIASPFIATYRAFKIEKKNNQLYFNYKTKIQQPNQLNFKGKIYVLINGSSFSSSAVLSAYLHATKRTTFVGEETGGAYNGTVAGFMREHELSNSKVIIEFGVMNIATPFKQNPDGYGIKPDKEILPTLEDRLNRIDPELDWVLKNIEGE